MTDHPSSPNLHIGHSESFSWSKRVGTKHTNHPRPSLGVQASVFAAIFFYWYNLPIFTQSILSYSEFRGYDIVFLYLLFHFVRKLHLVRRIVKVDTIARSYFYFSTWATATCAITFLVCVSIDAGRWFLVTLVFLFHLWGFWLTYCAAVLYMDDSKTKQAVVIFLAMGALVAVLIILQGTGNISTFWGERYSVYGINAYSGTLGPNRQLPGHAMLVLVAICFYVLKNTKRNLGIATILAYFTLLIAPVALIFTGSKTAWASMACFLVLTVLKAGRHLLVVVFVSIGLVVVLMFLPDSILNRGVDIFEWRAQTSAYDADVIEYIDEIDSGRLELFSLALGELADRPYLLPFGGGFNNYRHLLDAGASAHNAYITILVETGIVGLFLYLFWLTRILKASKRLSKKTSGSFDDVGNLTISLLVSLSAGEILYPYRPSFGFLGMFMILIALTLRPRLHPETRFDDK